MISPQTPEELRNLILDLESRKKNEWQLLKEGAHDVYTKLQPIAIIKDTLGEAMASPDFKKTVGLSALALTFSFLIKKYLVKSSSGVAAGLMGVLLETVIVKVVDKNSNKINSFLAKAASFFKPNQKEENSIE